MYGYQLDIPSRLPDPSHWGHDSGHRPSRIFQGIAGDGEVFSSQPRQIWAIGASYNKHRWNAPMNRHRERGHLQTGERLDFDLFSSTKLLD